jgi:hypothetical protein
VIAGLQLAATPLARVYTRRALANMEAYDGRVGDVTATVFPPTMRLTNLTMIEKTGGDWKNPLLEVPRLDVQLAWRKLADLLLVARVEAFRPEMRLVQRSRAAKSPLSVEQKVRKLPNLGRELERHAPLRIGVLVIREGKLAAVDLTRAPAPRLTLSDIDGTVDNLTTRRALAENRPTTLDATGLLQRSGRVEAHVAANPFAKKLDFHGRVAVEGLRVTDLWTLLESTQELRPVRGTIDVFAEFLARDGRLRGGVKPVLHDVKLDTPPDASVFVRLKAWLADAALTLFASDRPDRAVATVIPIKGDVTDPDAQLWPTIAGLVRNGFVEGVREGFQNLPPPTAARRESPMKQIGKALKGRRPKAEPGERSGK